MKQQNLKDIRNYQANPRSYSEGPVREHRCPLEFTESDYKNNPTKQSEAESADINHIMKKYEATGFLPTADGRRPQFGDFSTMETFQEAMHIVSEANSAFHSLNAEVRARFGNNPAEFLKFMEKARTDKKTLQEAADLGLVETKPESPDKILKDIRANTAAASKTKQPPNSTASSQKGEPE